MCGMETKIIPIPAAVSINCELIGIQKSMKYSNAITYEYGCLCQLCEYHLDRTRRDISHG
jgi:hypothetical protein